MTCGCVPGLQPPSCPLWPRALYAHVPLCCVHRKRQRVQDDEDSPSGGGPTAFTQLATRSGRSTGMQSVFLLSDGLEASLPDVALIAERDQLSIFISTCSVPCLCASCVCAGGASGRRPGRVGKSQTLGIVLLKFHRTVGRMREALKDADPADAFDLDTVWLLGVSFYQRLTSPFKVFPAVRILVKQWPCNQSLLLCEFLSGDSHKLQCFSRTPPSAADPPTRRDRHSGLHSEVRVDPLGPLCLSPLPA